MVNYEKIIDRLKEIMNESIEIKNILNNVNKQLSNELVDELERIVSRTYKNEDKKYILKDLHRSAGVWSGRPEEKIRDYHIKLDNVNRTCKIIIKEYELFGFEDFIPVKEKIETTLGLGKDTWGWKRKTTKEK